MLKAQEVMSETHQPRQALRSVGAVLAGMLTGIILSFGTDELLHLARVFPPWDQRASDALLLLATIYRTIYGVAGSYIAARLAPNRPLLHAMILGVLGLAASTAGAAVTWKKGPVFGRAPLVSRRARRAGNTDRLGRRQNPPRAVARPR
jgi:hypothetical protein